MKRRSFAYLGLVGLAVAIAAGDLRLHMRSLVRAESAATISPTKVSRARRLRTAASDGTIRMIDDPAPIRDRAAVRAELVRREEGTYIGDVLADRDSSLIRWPDRRERPLKVWIQSAPTVADWDSEFVQQARVAFTEWSATGIPVFFDFVKDSAAADVHVTWVERFAEPVSGKTLWARDGRYWMVNADIVLATHHSGGDPLDPSAIRALALHEVGHLLGLDHTPDVSTIMTPRVRVRELTSSDRATVRLLYSLPPGPVR